MAKERGKSNIINWLKQPFSKNPILRPTISLSNTDRQTRIKISRTDPWLQDGIVSSLHTTPRCNWSTFRHIQLRIFAGALFGISGSTQCPCTNTRSAAPATLQGKGLSLKCITVIFCHPRHNIRNEVTWHETLTQRTHNLRLMINFCTAGWRQHRETADRWVIFLCSNSYFVLRSVPTRSLNCCFANLSRRFRCFRCRYITI